ncbi:alkylation response protein AidB-like acyl-CoA dehydrogenase [Ilumatobacter fluminis]|uniref:Alkylation response protein AidB-like acyl-CoA dehydrogenase n=1 Tax=Ilumatobacter fluminis TaxID=467091 RepID=A0A4R7HY46_9ACTN|nr:acyl-CoA dehydrogenase family protein [Ilumatobacter fluminis]TDT16011.1 alkylation response protein AidB-like acyl-CoA dehydrogenase [Ilumatobacter fluminis]
MNFDVSEEMTVRLEMIREFMDREVIPLEGEMLHGDDATLAEGVAAAQAKVKQMGLWAPNHPVEYGGLGLSMVDHGLFAEAVGRSPLGMSVFGTQAPDAGNVEILHMFGTNEQHERWLRPLVAGEIRSCFSMTEPNTAGSNPTLLETTAVLERGEWVVNGQKWFSSSADGAAFAIVMAVTDPDAPVHRRASMIIVPTDTPGFGLVRNVSVMGHAGEGWASHAEVIYQGCRVPEGNLLGPRGGGFAIAQERLGPGRIHHCMRWLGIAQRAFEMMCAYANERVIEPDGSTLADKQVIQHWAAELSAEIRSARLLTLHAAWMIDRHGAKAARDEISAIKFTVANTMLRAVDTAIQVHGALGVTDDTVLAYWYRHERAARIYDGADEVHKSSLGRRIMRRAAPVG